MTTLTIELPDQTVDHLKAMAQEQQTSVELVTAAAVIEALTAKQSSARDKRLHRLMDEIVEENAELYRRLA